MKYPFEKQNDLKDCGVCSLLMLIKYYGGRVSKEYLRSITNTTKDGVDAYSLIEGAKKIGFSAYGVKGKIENLSKDKLPCISHVVLNKSYQHFIVIYQINFRKKYLIIADPSKLGITKISFEEFEKITTNQYILLIPDRKIDYIEKNTVLKDLIYKFIKNNYKKLLLIFVLSIIVTLFGILNSFQFKILLEYVINYQNISNLILLSIVFFYVILIKEISNHYRNNLINCINHNLDKNLFSNIYHHILSLPYCYYKNRTTGEIVSRINDLANIRDLISNLVVTILLDIILAIAVFITLYLLNSNLSFFLFFIIIILVILVFLFQKPLENKIKKSKEESAKLNSFLVETIGGIETIKNQNIQNFIEDNFLLKYCSYNKNSYSYNHLFLVQQFFKNIINECGTLIIMILGSYMVATNKLNIATLITFTTLTGYLLEPFKNIISLSLSWKEAKASFERISELYEVESENVELEQKIINHKFQGNIKTNHLMYSYNNKDLLLKDINIDIPVGSRVLISGASGSGKSTLAKILSKQLKVENKKIFYDDCDINNYPLWHLKKEICYVSQQETLFTDSVYRNIVLDKEIDYHKFLNTSKLCMIDEFIEKNILTYDMLLEENGFNLSGGQRQRIILARSILNDAKVFIFDESLNEVDIKKERKILKKLFNEYPDKTFIVISHRFNNQDLFTKKYYIKDGVSYEN